MSHPLQCRCGTVKAVVNDPRSANRVICHCKDCQAFAHFLGRVNDVLDERGGSNVIRTCLEQGAESLDASFGPVRVVVNTQTAKGEPKPKQAGMGKMVGWFFGNALKGRFNGDYKKTAFFRADGTPIVTPHILSSEEHARVMRAVSA
jgi:hypothetical protein